MTFLTQGEIAAGAVAIGFRLGLALGLDPANAGWLLLRSSILARQRRLCEVVAKER